MEDSAVAVLKRALDLDSASRFQESLICYQEGIDLLLSVLKATKDENKKAYYRNKISSYMNRAEKIKKYVMKEKEDGKCHKQIKIEENSKGFSYEKLFQEYLNETVTEVWVEDPYIRQAHQLYNFLRFCEMLAKGPCRMKTIHLLTSHEEEWLSKGHGEYREIPSEREFFQEVKGSKNAVCHFYKDSTFRCLILDKHLTILAKKHIETKFIKLNAEKSPFLCERLHIKIIPTLALIKDGKTQDYVVGFTDLGNTDEFTTETLEWRLGYSDIINYSGNLMEPPFQSQKKFGTSFTKLDKKTIRGKKYDSDSDDD